jgi:hypothetical protein
MGEVLKAIPLIGVKADAWKTEHAAIARKSPLEGLVMCILA